MYQLGYLKRLVHKKCLKPAINRAQDSTIWVLITPPNRHIASPLAMIIRRKIMQAICMQKEGVFCSKTVCISNALPLIRKIGTLHKNQLGRISAIQEKVSKQCSFQGNQPELPPKSVFR